MGSKKFFSSKFLHKLYLSCEELPTFVIIQNFIAFYLNLIIK
jgi:hypothetical protein